MDVIVAHDQMVAAAERELAMRRSVYPRWVKAGRMKQIKADNEIAAMEAIIDYLKSNGDPAAYQAAQRLRRAAVPSEI